MGGPGIGGNGGPGTHHPAAVADPSAAALFALVWAVVAELLGTAATAAIVRRAVRHGARQCPELLELSVRHQDLEYRYALPRHWGEVGEGLPPALRVLAAALGRLLVELTGTVVVRRLEQIPEVRARGLAFREESAT